MVQSPHEHNTDEYFDNLVTEARSSQFETSSSLSSDEELSDNYDSEYQKERTNAITAILNNYKDSYQNKIKFQGRYRRILFWGCSVIIGIFTFEVLYVLRQSIFAVNDFAVPGVITIVTGVLSLIVSILELVRIITKYCFPENDEEYIIKIVTSIQENDLEKYKEFNRASEARGKQN